MSKPMVKQALFIDDDEGEMLVSARNDERTQERIDTRSKLAKAVSLFCGIGGCDQGLIGDFYFLGKYYRRNPYRVVLANDIDKCVEKAYRLNFGNHFTGGDITNINSNDIPDHDILIGGFPCQPFSMSARPLGNASGIHDKRGGLFLEMKRVLQDKQPMVFVAENVKGLLSSRAGEDFRTVKESFESAGYDVAYKVLNAADFGVPQRRERVFIVGTRQDLRISFKFPTQTHSEKSTNKEKKWVPLKSVLNGVLSEKGKYLFSQKAVQGLLKANKMFNKGREQDLEKPCATISAHLAKVSLNGTDPVLRLPTKELGFRRFTPREAARIQSFPDSFKFLGSDLVQYRQIGNAVPPVLFWHLAREIYHQVFSASFTHGGIDIKVPRLKPERPFIQHQ